MAFKCPLAFEWPFSKGWKADERLRQRIHLENQKDPDLWKQPVGQAAVAPNKTWWTFRPRKKNLAPPPPQIPQFAADTLPAPRPLLENPSPPPGIFNKKWIPPPPGASDSPFPLPEQKNKK